MCACSVAQSYLTFCDPMDCSLPDYSAKDVVMCDRHGIIYKGREVGMNSAKAEIAEFSNKLNKKGSLADALKGADIFVGVSSPGLLTQDMVRSMNSGAIVMHPGPVNRGVELSGEVIDGENSYIEDQVLSGVAVRMALLKLLCENRRK